MKRIKPLLAAAWVCILGCSGAAWGQQAPAPSVGSPLVHLTQAQFRNLRDACESLAEQTQTAFILEAQPLHSTLPISKDTPDFSSGAPLSTVMPRLAAAYDYDAQLSGGVYVLKKRYTDPADLPALTLTECMQALQEVATLTDPFNPHIASTRVYSEQQLNSTPNEIIGALAASLSPEQLTALQAKTPDKRLYVSQLRPEQQALARRMGLYFYVQEPMEDVTPALHTLEEAQAGRVTFCWREMEGLRLFGYTVSYLNGSGSRFEPLSNPNYQVTIRGDSISIDTKPLLVLDASGKKVPATDDPTTPDTPTLQATPVPADTLASIVAVLNRRAPNLSPVSVDVAFREKPVIVFGQVNAPVGDVLKGLAAVYGLRVLTEDVGGEQRTRITSPLLPPVLSAVDLPDALRAALPEPFVRAMHCTPAENAVRPKPTAALLYHMQHPNAKQEKSDLEKSDELRYAAAKILRARLEPKLLHAPEIGSSRLDDVSQTAFADAVMVNGFYELRWIVERTAPDYISTPDKAWLDGGLSIGADGRQKISINLDAVQTTGPLSGGILGNGIGANYVR